MFDPNDQDPPEEPMTLVYIREEEGAPRGDGQWCIYHAVTGEALWNSWTRRGAIDYCNDQSWDVRDGPVGEEYAEEPARSAFCAQGQHNWVADPIKARHYRCADCLAEYHP